MANAMAAGMRKVAFTLGIGAALVIPALSMAVGSASAECASPNICTTVVNTPYVAPTAAGSGVNNTAAVVVAPATRGASAVSPVVAAPSTAAGSALPFTGADISEMSVVGAAALAGGLVLVRRNRRRIA